MVVSLLEDGLLYGGEFVIRWSTDSWDWLLLAWRRKQSAFETSWLFLGTMTMEKVVYEGDARHVKLLSGNVYATTVRYSSSRFVLSFTSV